MKYLKEKKMKITVTRLIFMFCVFLSAILNAQESEWIWQNPLPQGNGLFDVHVFDSGNAIAVGQTGTVLRTTNFGAIWLDQQYAGEVDEDLIGITFIDDNTGWAVGGNSTIFKSTYG